MVGPSLRLAFLAVAVAFGSAAAGCNQGNGERCEVNRDCQSGYYCDPTSGDNSGGICKPNGMVASDSGAGGTGGTKRPAASRYCGWKRTSAIWYSRVPLAVRMVTVSPRSLPMMARATGAEMARRPSLMSAS